MNNLWLKIKIWTKISVFALLAIYMLVFVVVNNEKTVTFWYFPGQEVTKSVLVFSLVVFFLGVIGAILTRMVFRTLRQIKDLRERNRITRNDRDLADIKAKAARLQSAPAPAPLGESPRS